LGRNVSYRCKMWEPTLELARNDFQDDSPQVNATPSVMMMELTQPAITAESELLAHFAPRKDRLNF